MSALRPATSYIVGTAFLFGVGFGALVILGLGAIAVALNSDDPVSPYLGALAPIALILAGFAFIGAVIRRGLRRDNRLRVWPVVEASLTTVIVYALAVIVTMVVFWRWEPASSLAHIGQALSSPASLVILLAAALSSWAYFGTLRWQARNAETRQFAPGEE